ncbi:M23 family metallopeptidase [Exiguobacterium sp. MMG028]|uniref:M23 family metallopeptidase n=1 Tax=Exiguobacterium sp. MMG028 TaxID=3021979 RepID=UPI0022FE302C|nr:M23 family metallopeptidase [Exiguobacterium sp. MMG028]MDA5561946.1 M23 family metallopeptidase [Exiguobacterium sp. MMG028]
MRNEVYYYSKIQNKRYDVTKLTSLVEVTGSVDRHHRTAQVQVAAKAGVPYSTGDRVRIYGSGRLIFDGRLFRVEHAARGGITLTCHDNAYYLSRNDLTVVYEPNAVGTTVSAQFKAMCRRMGIKQGFVKETATRIKDINYASESMATILQGLIAEEYRLSGRRYYVTCDNDKLELRERGALPGVLIDAKTTFDTISVIDAQNTYTRIQASGRPIEETTGTDGTNVGKLNSAYYNGPDSTTYQTGIRSRLKACDKWDDLFVKVAAEKGVDALMLKVLTAIESSGNPSATSHLGARGLTQIIAGNVEVAVDDGRLYEPEYNLMMCAEILIRGKYPYAKNLGRKASVTNLAHFWNGWPPSDGESDSAYAASFRAIYTGFGGDADKLFTTATAPSHAKLSVPSSLENGNAKLEQKLGKMTQHVTLSYTDPTDFTEQLNRALEGLKEERYVTVDCVGHHAGLSGRRVQFVDNPVTFGVWYIQSDTHTLDASGHRMTLTLTLTDETPSPEVPRAPKDKDAIQPVDEADIRVRGDSQFIQPAQGRFTQGWGIAARPNAYYTFHNGLDIANDIGTPVIASASGRVEKVGGSGPYGNHIYLNHFPDGKDGQKWVTVYAHLNSVSVVTGQLVTQGQPIGTLGNTGNSTGPHLHFEIHKGNYAYDPHGAGNTVNPREYF